MTMLLPRSTQDVNVAYSCVHGPREMGLNRGVGVRMKRIGIVGGIGPESTLEYYRAIIDAFRQRGGEVSYPEMIVYSANLTELLRIMEARDWGKLTEWLLRKLEALHRAGADFAAIASNTPHVVFDEVASRSPLPVSSIVEETCRHAVRRGLRRLGLMGTKFTMQSDFFQKAFQASGIAVMVPEPNEQELIHHRLFSEIELGIVKESTRQELLDVAKKLKDRHSIDGLILGCTELPLILTQDTHGLEFLNTTRIHVDSIVQRCAA